MMYKHLLIATDGSELAQKAVEHGLALAKALDARATAVFVTEPWAAVAYGEYAVAYPPAEYEKNAANQAVGVFSKVMATAAETGTRCETFHLEDQFPAEGIILAAKEKGCDLIVMASHGRRGLTRFLLGSQTNSVVTHSTIPVLVCR